VLGTRDQIGTFTQAMRPAQSGDVAT
jgi:hypothetical protein